MAKKKKSIRIIMPKRGYWSRPLWGQVLSTREEILDAIFDRSDDLGWSVKRLAEEAGLCVKTVHRLNRFETQQPYDTTLSKLAIAVGLHIGIQSQTKMKGKPKLKLAKFA